MMSWYGPGLDGWHWVGMTTTMTLFWALVVLGVVLAVRHLAAVQPTASTATPATEAEARLAERLARGEIDSAEYTGRLASLRGQVRS